MKTSHLLIASLTFCIAFHTFGQIPPGPDRAEGEGPYNRLIIRGVTIIDGTGAPAYGPADIIVENNIIKKIETVGAPGVVIDSSDRPKTLPGDKELNCNGMYLMPGFIDTHIHTGGDDQTPTAEYVYKLWMGHGITSGAELGSFNGLDWTLKERERSAANAITAPRIKVYSFFGQDYGDIVTEEDARNWVRHIKQKGADGIKFFGANPDLMKAAIEEGRKLGLHTTCHHSQRYVARANVLQTAQFGLHSMQHWYGLPEALFEDRTVQDFPLDYNYQNEQDRFGEAGRLWKQAAIPYSDHWNKTMDELLEMKFVISPTFVPYEASRDLQRGYTLEWHQEYTSPLLWEFYQPSRVSHGSYWHSWGTEQEIDWKNNYKLWMTFINEYKNRGGSVTAGSDCGFIWNLYGFGYIRELELLREAGFHPLEVIRSATLEGAKFIGMEKELGSIELGKLADFVIVEENPLENLKVLYGTGSLKLDENNNPVRVGGVKYTIKDGIVYDAKQLLEDVKKMVAAEKKEKDYEIYVPGTKQK